MLPGAGVYYFPWEINSSVPEGEALRTFGRLCCYNLARSEAVLSAQRSAAQHHVCVDTRLVEPFEAQLGSLYMVLGEAEHREAVGSGTWWRELNQHRLPPVRPLKLFCTTCFSIHISTMATTLTRRSPHTERYKLHSAAFVPSARGTGARYSCW
ncbi:CST complex subunit TEN1 isoform X2 [Cygnus atratus]|nr:CST complex subunit TEN1 isoform X2 [Cygnus atratus]